MNKICILGGDLRQETIYNLLKDDGFSVSKIGLSAEDDEDAAIKDCEVLILPIPVTYDNAKINAPLSDREISMEYVVSSISPGCIVLGGRISPDFEKALQDRGIKYFDYYNREELIIKNAIPTAEGAIEIAMTEMPITIFGSRVLIVGYGRIGKMLASRFKALGADVTVSARKHRDFAWIEESGCKYVHTGDISACINSYDIIINTVPSAVIDRTALGGMRKDSLIIDLASKPGGVDFASAKELGKNVIWALSLPGKTAPITSGKIIKDTIVNILTEMEVQSSGISG